MILLAPFTASAWVFGNGNSYTTPFSMSANGRYVAFQSAASNLVPNDTNGQTDIFVLDTQTGSVVRVRGDSSGAQAVGGSSTSPAISADGTKVAVHSDATTLVPDDNTNGVVDVFVHDLTTGVTERVNVSSTGNQTTSGWSQHPSLSANGKRIAFCSGSANLVVGDTNGCWDVFVRDLTAGSTTVPVTVSGFSLE